MTIEARASARERILDGARGLVARGGAAAVSMGDVAEAAGVSKALVHYHFHDKESLLLALAESVAERQAQRTRDALAGASGPGVLDALWSWLARALADGDVAILLALAQCDSERVRASSRRIADQRRADAAVQVRTVFTALGATPRFPDALLAETFVAFTDGLASAQALDPERDARPAFDALWLALLTLAE